MSSAESHPYYPPGVDIPGYAPNTMPLWRMLAPFGAMAGAAAVSAHRLAARNPRLGAGDRFSASWFALCGFLHCCFEGYFLLNRATLAASDGLFSQLWKEYALSDSRYLTGDVFTLCVEAITVTVWGPLSLAAAASVVRGSPRRHFLQAVVSTAHLYGVALYYATNEVAAAASAAAAADGAATSYSRPEPLYYWVYYVGFNAPWAVVPLWLLYDSYTAISRAAEVMQRGESRRKGA